MHITNIQLALIGIVMVVGLTFLWLAIQRLDGRMFRIETAFSNLEHQLIESQQFQTGYSHSEAEEAAAAALKDMKIFGNEYMVFSPDFRGANVNGDNEDNEDTKYNENNEYNGGTTTNVHITDVTEITKDAVKSVNVSGDSGEDHGEDLVNASKTKLNKLSIEVLRSLLEEAGLSTEGTKKVLVQRLLENHA